MNELVQLSRRAKAARDRYRQDVARLYDRRGFPRFPSEQHEARVNDLKAERNEVLREVERRASEIHADAVREAERAGQFVPMEVLDGLARIYVQNNRELVEADVASLSERELAERLEGVLRDSSTGARYLYYTTAKARRREIVERRVKAARDDAGRRPGPTPVSATHTALDYPLRRLEQVILGPEAERRAARWDEIAREAAKVAKTALLGARDAQSFAGVVAQRHIARTFAERQRREPVAPYVTSGGGRIADVKVR
jgi:hypothetical protein